MYIYYNNILMYIYYNNILSRDNNMTSIVAARTRRDLVIRAVCRIFLSLRVGHTDNESRPRVRGSHTTPSFVRPFFFFVWVYCRFIT